MVLRFVELFYVVSGWLLAQKRSGFTARVHNAWTYAHAYAVLGPPLAIRCHLLDLEPLPAREVLLVSTDIRAAIQDEAPPTDGTNVGAVSKLGGYDSPQLLLCETRRSEEHLQVSCAR